MSHGLNTFLTGMAPRYRVIGLRIIAKTLRGEQYLRKGQLIPRDTLPGHIEHLLACELIEPVDTEGEGAS